MPEKLIEIPTEVRNLKIGDVVKSYAETVPNMRVTRAPQLGQYGRMDYETEYEAWAGPHRDVHYSGATDMVTVLVPGVE